MAHSGSMWAGTWPDGQAGVPAEGSLIVGVQNAPDEKGPSPARRAVLTGGVAGLAAVAGATLGRAQPASAVTLPPSVVDWINVTNNPTLTVLAKGDGTTDDTSAIQAALNAASPGEVVYLPGPTAGSTVVGKYLVNHPLVVPSGVILTGCSPAGQLASSFTGMYGTILKVASTWSNNGLSNPGVIAFNGASGAVYNPVVKDLWIDFTSGPAPANVNGIASFDNVFHAVIDRVGIVAATGKGIYGQSNGSSGRPDGWSITNVIVEQPASDGIRYEGQDGFMCNVHAQNGNSKSGTGDGFVITGGNNRLVGCRADSCANGFTIDVRQNGVFSGTTTLTGCGTEQNSQNGFNVINSSSSATAMSDPVIATGCSFDGDGSAGIAVTGANIVILNACNVNVTSINSPATPQWALSLAANSGGSIPNLVQALGGWWTAASSTLVHGAANANVLSYGVHGFKGGQFVNGDAVTAFSVGNL
jgi:Pectate lyase superfamily protein